MNALAMRDMAWHPVPIPGSTPEVQMATLHLGDDGAVTAMVRFPPGWSRPGTGWYDHIEEILWIDGLFELGGHTYAGGDHTWLPAGYARAGSAAPGGALALAWFSGPIRWSSGPSPVADGAARGAVGSSWRTLAPGPSPLGAGQGRLLARGATHTSWVLDGLPSGARAQHPLEVLSLSSPAWARCEPGAGVPALDGPVFCRVWSPAGTAGHPT